MPGRFLMGESSTVCGFVNLHHYGRIRNLHSDALESFRVAARAALGYADPEG